MGFARIDAADAPWLWICVALALLTAPALALLYGEGGQGKNVKLAILRAISAIPILALQWILVGYWLTVGSGRGLLGALAYVGSTGGLSSAERGVTAAPAAFRMMFALTTPALVAGAFAERMKFRAYVAFVVCWSTLVFDPIAHWVWADGGWLGKLGVLDFAGGTVVYLPAGIATLVCLAVIGKRVNREPGGSPEPSGAVLAKAAGAALFLIACLGFNAARALPGARLAWLAFISTQLGAAAGGLGWLVVEWRDRGRVGPVGIASGIVAGLIAVAPAAGYVSPSAAIAIGFIGGAVSYGTSLGAVAGLSAALLAITADAGYVAPTTAVALLVVAGGICYGAVLLRERFGSSRSPDAFGTHAVAGLSGALLTGVFAQKAINESGADGALFGHSNQVAVQLLACVVAAAYSALVTLIILKVIDATLGLRVIEESAPIEDTGDRCDVTGVRERRPSAARTAAL